MRKPICIVSADWHLERNAWARYPELAGDAYYGLEQIVDLALLMKLPLIAAGDLFNKPFPDAKSVHVSVTQMERMQQADLRVFYVQGQHEKTKDQPWLGLHPWPIHLHKTTAFVGGHTFVGLDYTRPTELVEALQEVCPQGNVLVAHQVWREFMGIGHIDASFSTVPNDIELILTGDFHKHTTLVTKGLDGQDVLVLSPGSVCLQSVDEPPAKAVFILYDDFTVESVPIRARVINHYEVTTDSGLSVLLDNLGHEALDEQQGVPENIAKPILSIRYNPDIEDAYLRIMAVVEDRAHLFLKPIMTKVVDSTSLLRTKPPTRGESSPTTLADNLIKHCPVDSLTYDIAYRLLKSTNPRSELSSIEVEYLEANSDEKDEQKDNQNDYA